MSPDMYLIYFYTVQLSCTYVCNPSFCYGQRAVQSKCSILFITGWIIYVSRETFMMETHRSPCSRIYERFMVILVEACERIVHRYINNLRKGNHIMNLNHYVLRYIDQFKQLCISSKLVLVAALLNKNRLPIS